jgi:hypothetical protein
MPKRGVADPIGRTFKIIKLFNNRPEGVTVREIMEYLECSDPVARYFLDHASIYMPICVGGKRSTNGREAVVYRLLKYSENWKDKKIIVKCQEPRRYQFDGLKLFLELGLISR